jgi:hypothetical protein
MNALNRQKNLEKSRFVACENAAWLLTICRRAAGRVPVSKSVSPSHLSAGNFFRGEPSSRLPNRSQNLTRCEIFRGKVPRAKLKK